MSHDFPDGPDWNPEPLDDDPWDVPAGITIKCSICDSTFPTEKQRDDHYSRCLSEATEGDLSDDDA